MSRDDDSRVKLPTPYSPKMPIVRSVDSMPVHQSALESFKQRLEADALARLEKARNDYRAEVVTGVRHEEDLQTAKAGRELATRRLLNIDKEAEWHEEQVRAGLEETRNRVKTATAEADEIVDAHIARQEGYRAAAANARADRREAEAREQRIREQMEGSGDTAGRMKRLQATEIGLRAELLAIEERLEALLMDDTEGSAQKRRYHEAERVSVQERLSRVVHKLMELDDLL